MQQFYLSLFSIHKSWIVALHCDTQKNYGHSNACFYFLVATLEESAEIRTLIFVER